MAASPRQAPTRAERQAQTRIDLVDAAERLFTTQGFHPTSLDQVADAAGYTKGAVYSNFASKEDLFFAVYERRVERYLPEVRRTLAETPDTRAALLALTAAHSARRESEPDGWLCVFLEFWTHVLRHREHRDRFAAIHRRYVGAFAEGVARLATEATLDAQRLTVAMTVMATGLGLERLTQPDVIDAGFTLEIQRLMIDRLLPEAR